MNEYLKELEYLLRKLAPDDRESSLEYYTEYLNDGGFETYQQCVQELGTPYVLYTKIRADQSFKEGAGNSRSPKKNLNMVWVVILAVLASPIALPVAVALIAILVAVVVTIGAIMLSIAAVVIGIFILGIIGIGVGCLIILNNFVYGIFLLGGGLIVIGLLIAVFPAVTWLVRMLINGIKQVSQWVYQKTIKRN